MAKKRNRRRHSRVKGHGQQRFHSHGRKKRDLAYEVVLRTLWQLRAFRESFVDTMKTSRTTNNNVYDALHEVFKACRVRKLHAESANFRTSAVGSDSCNIFLETLSKGLQAYMLSPHEKNPQRVNIKTKAAPRETALQASVFPDENQASTSGKRGNSRLTTFLIVSPEVPDSDNVEAKDTQETRWDMETLATVSTQKMPHSGVRGCASFVDNGTQRGMVLIELIFIETSHEERKLLLLLPCYEPEAHNHRQSVSSPMQWNTCFEKSEGLPCAFWFSEGMRLYVIERDEAKFFSFERRGQVYKTTKKVSYGRGETVEIGSLDLQKLSTISKRWYTEVDDTALVLFDILSVLHSARSCASETRIVYSEQAIIEKFVRRRHESKHKSHNRMLPSQVFRQEILIGGKNLSGMTSEKDQLLADEKNFKFWLEVNPTLLFDIMKELNGAGENENPGDEAQLWCTQRHREKDFLSQENPSKAWLGVTLREFLLQRNGRESLDLMNRPPVFCLHLMRHSRGSMGDVKLAEAFALLSTADLKLDLYSVFDTIGGLAPDHRVPCTQVGGAAAYYQLSAMICSSFGGQRSRYAFSRISASHWSMTPVGGDIVNCDEEALTWQDVQHLCGVKKAYPELIFYEDTLPTNRELCKQERYWRVVARTHTKQKVMHASTDNILLSRTPAVAQPKSYGTNKNRSTDAAQEYLFPEKQVTSTDSYGWCDCTVA